MKKKCVSCGVEVIKGYTEFKCPACGKESIIRCVNCRTIGADYGCPACKFSGP